MISTNSSIETLAKENLCHVVVNQMIPSVGVFTDETFCNVNRNIEPLSNKLTKSECSMQVCSMNQLTLVGGIPRKSCDNTSSVNAVVRATIVAITNCNTEDGRDMR
jgi:hypothetical protein